MFYIDDAAKGKKVLLAPVPVMIYLVFDYIIGKLRGRFVYGIFEVNEISFAAMVLVGCGVYVSLLVIAVITKYVKLFFIDLSARL